LTKGEIKYAWAFVATQTEIAVAITAIKRVHERAKADGHVLKTSDESKEGIMKVGNPIVASNYSRVQVMDAFANYFKHRDEWVSSWAKLKKESMKTAAVITAAGAQQGSSGNLRTALETLKIDYKNLAELVKEVVVWEKATFRTYKQELASLKLL
jgi:hypothetical protein